MKDSVFKEKYIPLDYIFIKDDELCIKRLSLYYELESPDDTISALKLDRFTGMLYENELLYSIQIIEEYKIICLEKQIHESLGKMNRKQLTDIRDKIDCIINNL